MQQIRVYESPICPESLQVSSTKPSPRHRNPKDTDVDIIMSQVAQTPLPQVPKPPQPRKFRSPVNRTAGGAISQFSNRCTSSPFNEDLDDCLPRKPMLPASFLHRFSPFELKSRRKAEPKPELQHRTFDFRPQVEHQQMSFIYSD